MNKITPERPNKDDHFRLLPCLCGADEAVYVTRESINRTSYRVVCPVCGAGTGGHPCKHDAQAAWNEAYRRQERRRTV